MGVYSRSVLYHGRLLSQTAYNRVAAQGQDYLQQITDDCWILYVPGRLVTVGFLDPVIEDHEKTAGVVSKTEIDAWLVKNPDIKIPWDSVSKEQLQRLEELVQQAAGGDSNQKPGTYICETEWCTLDFADTAHIRVKFNIIVK